jgi:RNA-binding protein YhbY
MLLRNQIDKINDAHTITKILTIEKMIKVKMEHDDMEKKKNIIFRIREDKHRASLVNRSRN